MSDTVVNPTGPRSAAVLVDAVSRSRRFGRTAWLGPLAIWVAMARPAQASVTVFQMSFEDAAAASDVVALGRVVESPEFGTEDPRAGVIRRHRVRVERYLQGRDADEIAVMTVGGKFVRQTDHGPEVYEGWSDAAPQLPEPGSDVVLFLRRWGDGYTFASATHGIIPVTTDKDGASSVLFAFKRLDLVPPVVRDAIRAHDCDATSLDYAVTARVPVGELGDLFDRLHRPLR